MLWVQNCSYGTLKAHRDAIDASPNIQTIDAARVRVALWEWRRKKAGRKLAWFLRTQTRSSYGGPWDELSEWEGPLAL